MPPALGLRCRSGPSGFSRNVPRELLRLSCRQPQRRSRELSGMVWWAHKGSNLGPLPCEGNFPAFLMSVMSITLSNYWLFPC